MVVVVVVVIAVVVVVVVVVVVEASTFSLLLKKNSVLCCRNFVKWDLEAPSGHSTPKVRYVVLLIYLYALQCTFNLKGANKMREYFVLGFLLLR